VRDGVFSGSEAELIKAALSDKALVSPMMMQKDILRASILKSVASAALKRRNYDKKTDSSAPKSTDDGAAQK
jgi:transcriptional regulator CtsR